MRAASRVLALLSLVALLAAGCTSAGGTDPPPGAPPPGGTLRVGVMTSGGSLSGWCPLLFCGKTYDPQSTTFVDTFELSRCCLMRTLLSYSGAAVAEGGTRLRPDLARALPTVSPDGLTWTFRLRPGVRYAPPMARTEIVAADFVRSFERTFTPAGSAIPWANGDIIGGYWINTYLADVIAGVHEFTQGKVDHVSGLQAPDAHTLVISLTQPVGDLGYRVALPMLGPIPANPDHPGDPLGVAQGHDFDYGDVLVSSGPYMFQGSQALSYALPPEDQLPPAGNGFVSATLVRNPSWAASVDPIRHAWADRIVFSAVDSASHGEQLVRSGELDLILNSGADARSTDRWVSDPDLRPRISVTPRDAERFLFLNLAIPPFDDIHVRRAVNEVVDRRAVASAFEGDGTGSRQQVLTHLALDSYEDNLLLSYGPPGVGASPDVASAMEEMRASRYDTNGDGRCDGPVCSTPKLDVRASVRPAVRAARAVAADLRSIGLEISLRPQTDEQYFAGLEDPAAHVALRMDNWIKDFPSASTFFPVLLKGENIGTTNLSMLGASPRQLRTYGYAVRSVPSADDRISACEAQVFSTQTRCWAQLDQYLSEQVVPWIPLTQELTGWQHSSRVASFAVDASIGIPLPALDNIRLNRTTPEPGVDVSAAPPPGSIPAIPDGVYRFTVTLGDIVAAGGPADDDQDTGTFTVVMNGGRFLWHQRAEAALFNPIAVGVYEGEANEIQLHVEQPPDNAVTLSQLTWRLDGQDVVFALPRCTGPAAHDPGFCGVQRAIFTAHPWERVTEVSGGPF